MYFLRSALPAALALSLVGVAHAEFPEAEYSSINSQGKLTVAISGACSGKAELTPAFTANYGWAYSVTDVQNGSKNKKPGTNKTRNGGMALHAQTAGLKLHFPDFEQQVVYGDYSYSYGGDIFAGTGLTNKTVFSLANKGSTQTFKLSGAADMSIEKVLYQMYEDGNISCKGDFDFAELMPRYDYDDYDYNESPFDLRGNTSKHTLSLTHTGSETDNKFTVKYTGQIELDVANVCTGTAQNGNWHPSDNFALKSLSCKGGAPVKVKISFDGSGNSQQQIR